jgi:hypothetical protein
MAATIKRIISVNELVEAPCVDCLRETLHDVLNTTEVDKVDYHETFDTLQCRGCNRVSLREITVIRDEAAVYSKRSLLRLIGLQTYRVNIVADNMRAMLDVGYISPEKGLSDAPPLFKKAWEQVIANPPEHRYQDDTFVQFYPPPTSRRRPDWAFPSGKLLFAEEGFLEVLDEIYVATRNCLPHLAIMGIRAILEQTMIKHNGGDCGSFERNLNEFQKRGLISLVQRDSLEAILQAGHAVIHRGFKVTEDDLNTALNIMEGVLAAIDYLDEPAQELLSRLPLRPPRKSEPPSTT